MDPVCLNSEAEPGDEYCRWYADHRPTGPPCSLFLASLVLGPCAHDDGTIQGRLATDDSQPGIGHRNLATCKPKTNLRKHREISRFHAHLAPNVNETRVRVRVRVSAVVLAVDACGWCVLASRNSQLACKTSKTSRRRQDARK